MDGDQGFMAVTHCGMEKAVREVNAVVSTIPRILRRYLAIRLLMTWSFGCVVL